MVDWKESVAFVTVVENEWIRMHSKVVLYGSEIFNLSYGSFFSVVRLWICPSSG